MTSSPLFASGSDVPKQDGPKPDRGVPSGSPSKPDSSGSSTGTNDVPKVDKKV